MNKRSLALLRKLLTYHTNGNPDAQHHSARYNSSRVTSEPMASQIGEREKETLPSQPVANPKDARSTPSSPD